MLSGELVAQVHTCSHWIVSMDQLFSVVRESLDVDSMSLRFTIGETVFFLRVFSPISGKELATHADEHGDVKINVTVVDFETIRGDPVLSYWKETMRNQQW